MLHYHSGFVSRHILAKGLTAHLRSLEQPCKLLHRANSDLNSLLAHLDREHVTEPTGKRTSLRMHVGCDKPPSGPCVQIHDYLRTVVRQLQHTLNYLYMCLL